MLQQQSAPSKFAEDQRGTKTLVGHMKNELDDEKFSEHTSNAQTIRLFASSKGRKDEKNRAEPSGDTFECRRKHKWVLQRKNEVVKVERKNAGQKRCCRKGKERFRRGPAGDMEVESLEGKLQPLVTKITAEEQKLEATGHGVLQVGGNLDTDTLKPGHGHIEFIRFLEVFWDIFQERIGERTGKTLSMCPWRAFMRWSGIFSTTSMR